VATDIILLTIVFSENLKANTEIRLLDLSGKLIQSGIATGKTHQLNVSSLRNGIYIVKIIGTNLNLVKTISKE
jgi:23S rRNA-/tRNA-specific pseudouridylate synthase